MDPEDVLDRAKKASKSFLGKLVVALVVIVALGIAGLILFRWTCVNFVDNYELAYKYDLRDGKIERVLNPDGSPKTGYIVTWPFIVKVHTVDLRPMQVCINANKRVLNCKLVQFDQRGLELFLSWHGRNNYDGASEATGDMNDILKSYAYDGSGKVYSFLSVLRELKPEEVATR